jgi:Tfp pilus assembly protein PilO
MIGTALLVIATVALGWVLGISPQLKEASTAAEETAAVDAQNVVNTADLEALKKQFAEIDSIRDELGKLEVALPGGVAVTSFLRQIDALSTQHGVTVEGITPGAAEEFDSGAAPDDAAAVEGEEPAAPAPSASSDADERAAEIADVVADASKQVDGGKLIAVEMTIAVSGPYDAVLAFTQGLQLGDRLFMANGLTMTQVGDMTVATDSRAYEGTITGLIYVIP